MEMTMPLENYEWTISVCDLRTGEQLATWQADQVPDVLAIKAYYATRPVKVVQYRFLDHYRGQHAPFDRHPQVPPDVRMAR